MSGGLGVFVNQEMRHGSGPIAAPGHMIQDGITVAQVQVIAGIAWNTTIVTTNGRISVAQSETISSAVLQYVPVD